MAKRKNIATLLKQWRKRRSKELGRPFTQEEGAVELGLNPSTFIQYEHGRRGQKMNQMLYDTIIAKTTWRRTRTGACWLRPRSDEST